MIADRAGGLAIALSGVDEVTFARTPTGHFRRHGVGQRPSALALRGDRRGVFVANSLSDTISEVEINSGLLVRMISLGARPSPTLVEQGERLFYDARLSHDGWMSCHTCHTDGHSNGQLVDTLGDGSYGAAKRVPSLLGTAATGPWTWTGSVDRLEDQVRKSVEKTMRGHELPSAQVEALTAYLRSLSPPRATLDESAEAITRGREVFRAQSCADCHSGPHFTTRGTYDVGLSDTAGNTKFNPPSLRGVGGRSPLLHDGRAATLEDLLLKHKHPNNNEMTPAETADLVAYLKSL
jgi:cytochrome c peroxidase